MSKEFSGKGDPKRTMELLWGVQKQTARGPKPGISLEQIVGTAIAIADQHGLAQVSMRKIAEQLQVGTMSLYTYVPSKAELCDLMLDRTYSEHSLVGRQFESWREALELRAKEDWERYLRHPWILQISGVRSLLGPNETELYELTLRGLLGIGLTGREISHVVSLVTGYVRGAAQSAVDALLAAQQTGMSNEEWWAAREPLFDSYYDPKRFPTLDALAVEGAFEPIGSGDYLLDRAVDEFAFGLERVLDGIAVLVERRVVEATR